MSYLSIQFKDFNWNNNYNRYFVSLKDVTYTFIVRWSFYCNCAFLTILDNNDNEIISSIALVNGLKIRHNQLPYEMFFMQINEETYEPTLDNIGTEFVLFCDDGEEE